MTVRAAPSLNTAVPGMWPAAAHLNNIDLEQVRAAIGYWLMP
jgi:hypothetical protein